MNRRTFVKLSGLGGCLGQSAKPFSPLPLPSGLREVSRGQLVLTSPPDKPRAGVMRYALSFPFQAGPRTIGLMAMRMTEQTPNYGFLDGSDIVLLDELSSSASRQVFAASRNEREPGEPGGTPRLFMKSPLIGGFVPRGALLQDGNPHPYAGTGFGVGQAHWFPFSGDRFSWRDPQRRDMNEVYQLSYDGKNFTSHRTEVRPQNEDDPLRIGSTEWAILVTGIHNAIPDGKDLLFSTLAVRLDRTAVSVGVVRWVCRDQMWRPTGYDSVVLTDFRVPRGPNVMERCPWQEPSLARDADGSLLFSARGADAPGPNGYTLRVWRSDKAGEWKQILDAPKARLNSPVTINVAADGAPYLASSPYDPAFIPETQANGRGREKLSVWALSADRTSLAPPLLIRDCLADFGEPPSAVKGEKWMADHPNGMTVRLKDGIWRHILCYRVCHSPRYESSGTMPSPHSGSYIEEVRGLGKPRGLWRFND